MPCSPENRYQSYTDGPYKERWSDIKQALNQPIRTSADLVVGIPNRSPGSRPEALLSVRFAICSQSFVPECHPVLQWALPRCLELQRPAALYR